MCRISLRFLMQFCYMHSAAFHYKFIGYIFRIHSPGSNAVHVFINKTVSLEGSEQEICFILIVLED